MRQAVSDWLGQAESVKSRLEVENQHLGKRGRDRQQIERPSTDQNYEDPRSRSLKIKIECADPDPDPSLL